MPVDVWAIDSLTFSGLEARNVEAIQIMTDGTALGSRSGVRPGDPGLTVTLAGTTINCSAGVAAIGYSGQGVYRVAFPSSVSPGAYTAAHATLNRIDLVYLRVWDTSVDASGLAKGDIVYLAGTPSASPVAPTPAGTQIYMPLATVTVLSVSNGGTASVSTAVRPFTVAPGGILPTATAPSSPYTGQYYDDGTGLLRYNGSTWDTYYKVPGAWTPYTPAWTASTNPAIGNGTITGRYMKIGRNVLCQIILTTGSTTTYGSGQYAFGLPFALASSGLDSLGTTRLTAGATYIGQCLAASGASVCSAAFPNSGSPATGANMTPTAPATLASGHILRLSLSYESAT
jgi:hypothetical protein